MEQANLAIKNNIANFIKKTNFDNKIKTLNKKFALNKTKHELVEIELNELSKKVKGISTKVLKKDLIKNFVFLMAQNISILFYSILHLYKLQNTLNVLVELLDVIYAVSEEHTEI